MQRLKYQILLQHPNLHNTDEIKYLYTKAPVKDKMGTWLLFGWL